MTSIEDVAQLLRSGQTPAAIQRLVMPETWRQAMRVCAAAGTFGTDLYDRVLTQHLATESPRLAELADRGLVEQIQSTTDAWRVPRNDAASWMLDWRVRWVRPGAPPELVALESELAAWHAEDGDQNEQLRHLLVADTAAAVALFERLFRAADEARDYARCQDLLNVLEDPHRITYAGPGVSDLRLDRAGYLRARLYWSGDFSRSAQFLEPDGLRERADALLSGSVPRVWQLFAPTGVGKTMQVQWLVARRCVPAAADIPCARIDFDVVDAVNVARYPWLLLLEVADQLERRWPRRVFERLDRYSSYRSLVHQQTSELTRSAAKGIAARDVEEVERQITAVFVRRVNEAAGDKPVLLVVDTLEELLLSYGGAEQLLRLLAQLVRDCPALRLVLAGRYDLRVRTPDALAAFGLVESVELKDFSAAQATRYLTEIRKIDNRELCRAVVDRTDGHPFLVALFADLIEQEPKATPEDLRTYQEPALRLLLDRVIMRIADDDVRWLVRYGVVPRRLRYDDVVTVMRPFLVRGRAGPTDQDDPRTDQHHLTGTEDVFPFGTPPRDDEALAAAWRRLLDYAAYSSWVSKPAGDGRTVIFHQNVRAPMRELISHHAVFRDLHEAFRQRFDELAAANPAASVAYLRESVYHRLQMAEPTAVDFWRTQVLRCRDRADLDGLADLARDLLSDDYLDETGAPRQRVDDRPLVPWAAIVQAHVWLAYVAVEHARAVQAAASDPSWAEAEHLLARAADARGRSSESVAETALEQALHAAVLCIGGEAPRAIALAEAALPTAPEDDLVDLLRVCGDARTVLGDPAAESNYRDALNVAEARGRTDQVQAVALSLARQTETSGRLDEAVEWCYRAGATSERGSSAARLLLARLLLASFEPTAALESLNAGDPLGLGEESERARLRAKANLMLGRAESALADLDAAAVAAESMPAPAKLAHKAQVEQQRGVVLGELLMVDEAETSFLFANSLWSEIGFADGHPECSYLYCRFLLRDVGDVAAAATVRRPAMEVGDELGVLWDELSDELRTAQGLPPMQRADSAGVGPGHSPQLVAWSIAAQLSRSWQRHRHLLPLLVDALGKIQPPSARLGVLEELCRSRERLPLDDVAQLRPLFPGVRYQTRRRHQLRDPDIPVQQSLIAELERLSGNSASAKRLLEDVLTLIPGRRDDSLARWRWLLAIARLGEPLERPERALPDTTYPLLRAASLLVGASIQPFDDQRRLESREMLAEARALCRNVVRPTRWAADIARAEGEMTDDGSLLAVADDTDRQLGIRRDDRPPPSSTHVLANRPEEWVVTLARPDNIPADPVDLQYRIVDNWPLFASSLASKLAEVMLADDRRGQRLSALRLESDDLAVQSLPWELAVSLEHGGQALPDSWRQAAYRSMPQASIRVDVRWLQRLLGAHGADLDIDGVMGPRTVSALDQLTPGPGPVLVDEVLRDELESGHLPEPGPQPVVVLIRPEARVLSEVASHGDYGYDVADLYASYGFLVEVVPSLDWLHEIDAESPAVLHLSGRLDYRGAGPYLDLSPAESAARWQSKERGIDLKPKDVARWLGRCRPGQEPLIVLDPPYPGSSFDVPWQLLLRNMFAATLFAEGHAPVVIATGLRKAGESYVGPIAAGLRQGLPLVSIVEALRPPYDLAIERELAYQGWHGMADALAARATAVFAAPSAFDPRK